MITNILQKAIEEIRAEYNQNENIIILRRTDYYVLVLSEKLGIVSFEFKTNIPLATSNEIRMTMVEIKTQKEMDYTVAFSEYQLRGNIEQELAFYEKYVNLFSTDINQLQNQHPEN